MNGWSLVAAAGITTVAAGIGIGIYDPRSEVFGRVIGRGARSGRELFLTFDDGPNPTATPFILETLAKAGAPAAFFLVGEYVRLHPGLARAVAAAGHEVGNHTQTHRKLAYRGPRFIARELREAQDEIARSTGVAPRSFRAPHGLKSPFVHASAERLGCDVVGWTFGVWDHQQPPAEEIRRRVRVRLRPGAIILLHDGDGYDARADRARTAEALPGILHDARSAGYTFRPLGDLLRSR